VIDEVAPEIFIIYQGALLIGDWQDDLSQAT